MKIFSVYNLFTTFGCSVFVLLGEHHLKPFLFSLLYERIY